MTEFLLKLTPADLSVIDKGLQEVILRLSFPVLQKINAQIAAQQQTQDEPSNDAGQT